jgi:hypothetical protein
MAKECNNMKKQKKNTFTTPKKHPKKVNKKC